MEVLAGVYITLKCLELCRVTFSLDWSEVCVDGKFPLFLATRNKAEKSEMVVARCSWNIPK